MRESRNGLGSRWWGWVVAAAGAAVILAGVGAWWLVDPLSVDEPKDRASAIQAAFTIAFGFGGIATLGLFTRRQWHQERVHEHQRQVAEDAQRNMERTHEHQQRVADDARYDAEQRRITEQYMQAVEQLGHEKAPVRLGGLYALDRLGRNHPEQRQVIAEVWCAYLRRKYTPPADILNETSSDEGGEEESCRTEEQRQTDAEAADEYEVRMTAQRLLVGHLRDPRPHSERNETRSEESEDYWHLERIDLTGATLVSADFAHCRVPRLSADRARFYRLTSFSDTYFEDNADFSEGHFCGKTEFRRAHFNRDARFGMTCYEGDASFGGVHFGGDVDFHGTCFKGIAIFYQACFMGVSWFYGIDAKYQIDLNESRFEDMVRFEGLVPVVALDAVEAAPAPRVSMEDAVVERNRFLVGEHAWPSGWETVPDGNRWRLVRVED